ncbi:MAG: hypothetical protein V3V82_02625 [Acidimicrobiia bacterium]
MDSPTTVVSAEAAANVVSDESLPEQAPAIRAMTTNKKIAINQGERGFQRLIGASQIRSH